MSDEGRMKALFRQFGHPEGALGWFVGHLMAIKNGARSRFALELLAPHENERVLEIGFGPGADVARLLRAVGSRGLVAGVDVSSEMLRHATRRNREAIAERRAELRFGRATALPFADGSFDAVYATNSAQFWGDIRLGFEEARRVLVPSGRAVVVVQPMSRGATRQQALDWQQRLVEAAHAAGFSEVTAAERELGPKLAVAAVARA
jgi:ubiquinone/menaquinone biosynthesis C-methylase UbiE